MNDRLVVKTTMDKAGDAGERLTLTRSFTHAVEQRRRRGESETRRQRKEQHGLAQCTPARSQWRLIQISIQISSPQPLSTARNR